VMVWASEVLGLERVIGLDSQRLLLTRFVQDFRSFNKRALLFHGPPGTGKTFLVHCFCKHAGVELVEVNASDKRDAANISRRVGAAVRQGSLFGVKRLVLVDEVDDLCDRGGASELARIIKDSPTPVVLTCNDAWARSVRPLRSHCLIVEFKPYSVSDLVQMLRVFCNAKGVKYSVGDLRFIAENACGDARSAINDLQSVVVDGVVSSELVHSLGSRSLERSVFDALRVVFKSRDFREALGALDGVNMDLRDKLLWLSENAPREFRNGEVLARVFNYLSLSDVFLGRVGKQQYYRFWWYANLLPVLGISGFATSNTMGFTRYSFPSRIRKAVSGKAARLSDDALCDELARSCHVSTKKFKQHYLPLIKKLKNT